MRRRWMLGMGGAAALLGCAGGFLALRRLQTAPAKAAATSTPAARNAPELTLTGVIQAARAADVPVPLDGTVEQFMADVGQHVSEGEVLARIRNPRLAAAQEMAKLEVEQAQNRLNQLESALIAARLEVSRSEADAIRVKLALDQAEKVFARQRTMFQEGVTPRLSYEKAEQDYQVMKAQAQNLAATAANAADRVDSATKELDPARKALAQKTSELQDAEAAAAVGEVNSLTDGVVIARRGRLGEKVTTAISDLFRIAGDPQVLEAVANTNARIQPGQKVIIVFANTQSRTGAIREAKSGQVFIDIANPALEVRAGMAVQIRIQLP